MNDVDDLLQKTSRTFAVTIPMLPSPTRLEVGVAYLLFRIIDTFEDGARWPADRRILSIQETLPLLDGKTLDRGRAFADRCLTDPPVEHPGYLELLHEIPTVMMRFESLSEPARRLIRAHVRRSGEGMMRVVARSSNGGRELALQTLEDLR